MRSKRDLIIKTRYGMFKVRIWWDKRDRAYLVKGVGLPDAVTFGRTLAEAKRMAREALELYCVCAIDEKSLIDSRVRPYYTPSPAGFFGKF